MATEATYKRPLPNLERKLTQPYWEATKRHELMVQQCDACQHMWFPPSFCCPKCLGEAISWTRVSGRAKIWSWIDMWQLYFQGFADERPYLVVYVELEEGPRLMATLVDIDEERTGLYCDMPLEVVFEDVTSEVTLPKFRPIH